MTTCVRLHPKRLIKILLLYGICGLLISSTVVAVCVWASALSEVRSGKIQQLHFGDTQDKSCVVFRGFGVEHVQRSISQLIPVYKSYGLESESLERRFGEWSDIRKNKPGIFEEEAFGWPFYCMRWYRQSSNGIQGGISLGGTRAYDLGSGRLSMNLLGTVIPMSPIWIGLVANSVLYGMLLLSMKALLVQGRSGIRARRGLCRRCGYDLHLSNDRACPECASTHHVLRVRGCPI